MDGVNGRVWTSRLGVEMRALECAAWECVRRRERTPSGSLGRSFVCDFGGKRRVGSQFEVEGMECVCRLTSSL